MMKHTARPGQGEYAPGQLYAFARSHPSTSVMTMLVLATTRNGSGSTVTRLIRVADPNGQTLLRIESLLTDVRTWDGIAEARS